MWTHRRSSLLSLILCVVFLAALLVAVVTGPWLVRRFLTLLSQEDALFPLLLTALYLCAVPAAVALVTLIRLLYSLRQDEVFTEQNVRRIRWLSWCCAAVAVVCLVCGCFYLPFLLIMVAAGFMALILRVIKNVFAAALELKEENRLTI